MSIFKALISPVTQIIREIVPNGDQRFALEQQIERLLIEQEKAFVEAGRDVVVAEATGESWLQRNWRPISMLVFVAVIANNYLIAPYVQAFGGVAVVLEIPPGMWGLLTMGLGGYVVGRTLEKTGSHIRVGGVGKG
ncbi:MAG: hypothetical protein JKX99_02770 [Robiginitomaculum sp.]|nr:hypothetical protein [Robiginitomaculum sp.]